MEPVRMWHLNLFCAVLSVFMVVGFWAVGWWFMVGWSLLSTLINGLCVYVAWRA